MRPAIETRLESGAGYIAGFAGYAWPGTASKCPISLRGELTERSKAAVLKTARGRDPGAPTQSRRIHDV
jgi:hypothetical protein